MKKVFIALIAVMLVVILAFSMFACDKANKNNGTTNNGSNTNVDNGNGNGGGSTDTNNDNGGNGGTTPGGNGGNGGSGTYTPPTPGNLTAEDIRTDVGPLMTKIAATFGEESNVDDITPMTLNIIAAELNAAGINSTTLKKYTASISALWDAKLGALFAEIMDLDEDTIYPFIRKILVKDNIQAGLDLFASVLNDADADKAIAIGLCSLELFTNSSYRSYDYDYAAVQTLVKSSGIDAEYLKTAEYYAFKEFMTDADTRYVIDTVYGMLKRFATYSAEELEQTADVIVSVMEMVFSDDFDISTAISSTGIGDLSFKDLIKVVNTAGKILDTMLSGVDDAKFGAAVGNMLEHVFALAALDVSVANVKKIASHPELLHMVANVLKDLTAAQVSDIYMDYSDWDKKKDTDKGDKAFAVMVGGVVNMLKAEYNKLSTEAKADISAILGDADLYKDVDAVIALIPADKDTISDESAKQVVALCNGMWDKLDFDGFFADDSAADGKAYLVRNYWSSAEAKGVFVIANASVTKSELIDKLDALGYRWRYNTEYSSVSPMQSLAVEMAIEQRDGKTYAKLTGDAIRTTYVELRANSDGVKISAYTYSSSPVRIAKGADAQAAKEAVESYLDNYLDSFYVYDSATKRIYYISEDVYSDFTVTTVDVSAAGRKVALVDFTTPYGVCHYVAPIVVYDPANLQLEDIRAEYSDEDMSSSVGYAPIGATVEDVASCLKVYAYYDDGSSEVVDGYTLTGLDTTKRGNCLVKVTYQGVSTSIDYRVYDPDNLEVTYWYVSGSNGRYAVGATADMLNFTIYVNYDNGRSEYLYSGYTVSGFDTTKRGDYSAKVTYGGKTHSYDYHVYDPNALVVTSIYCYTGSSYVPLGATLEDLGLYLDVYTDDGRDEYVYNGFDVSGFVSNTVGQKSLTVTYAGKTATRTYTVYDPANPVITSISVGRNTSRIALNSTIDALGVYVYVYTDDGNSKTITEGFEVSGFDASTRGNRTLTVTYAGKTGSTSYIVYDPANPIATSIDVWGEDTIAIGATLEDLELGVEVYTDAGRWITLKSGEYTVSGFDATKRGGRSLKVTYGGKTSSYKYYVYDPANIVITAISIEGIPSRIAKGSTLADFDVYVEVYTDDGDSESITTGYELIGFDTATRGDRTLKVTYQGKTATLRYHVYDPKDLVVTSINADYSTYRIAKDSDVSALGLYVYVYTDDGNNYRATSGFEVSGFSSSTRGYKSLTVKYQGRTDSVNYYVYDPANPVVNSISVSMNSSRIAKDSTIDALGLQVRASVDSGTSMTVTDYTVNGFDTSARGDYTLRITYGGKSQTRSYYVYDPANPVVTNMDVYYNTSTLALGDTIEEMNLRVWVYYDTGDSDMLYEGFTVSGFDTSASGEYTMTVTCGSKSEEVDYYVYDPANPVYTLEIRTENNPYVFVGSSVNAIGLYVNLREDNGASTSLSPDQYTLTGFDSTKTGTRTLTAVYGEYTATKEYTVFDYDEVDADYVYLDSCAYYVLEGSEASALEATIAADCYVYFPNGESYWTCVYTDDVEIVDFDSSLKEGQDYDYRSCTVSFEGQTCSASYYVISEATYNELMERM